MELLSLGKLDKGAATSASKVMLRNEMWFNKKQKKPLKKEPKDVNNGFYIQPDSLIQVKCKHRSFATVEFYHVLAFFTKYYNKWFVSEEETFPWVNDTSKKSNVKVLVRLMTKSGRAFVNVQLEKYGDWGLYYVFRTVNFDNIVKVEMSSLKCK
eukprot:1781534-Ditylum_brightwellii.AAC.1